MEGKDQIKGITTAKGKSWNWRKKEQKRKIIKIKTITVKTIRTREKKGVNKERDIKDLSENQITRRELETSKFKVFER